MAVEFDYSKLHGRIIEKYKSQKAFVEQIPACATTLTQKLKGRISFKNSEIMEIAEKLDISKEEIPDYFFCVKR